MTSTDYETDMRRLLALIDGAEIGIEIAHGRNLRDHGQGDYMRGFRDALSTVRDYIEDPRSGLEGARAESHYADDCARSQDEKDRVVTHVCNERCENRWTPGADDAPTTRPENDQEDA